MTPPRSHRLPIGRLRFVAFLTVAVLSRLGAAEPASASAPELKLVIVLGRHGVRSPIQSNALLNAYSAEPWPTWSVPPGDLTAHGARQMSLLGAYYHARYRQAGLLTGDPGADAARLTIRADTDERTIRSAQLLAAGLLQGDPPKVIARALNAPDPLFSPIRLGVGSPNVRLAEDAVLGRLGGDPANEVRAHLVAYRALDRVLFGSAPVPPGKADPLQLSSLVVPGEARALSVVGLSGPVRLGLTLVDALLLEYAEGLPMEQVGWGRLDEAGLTQLLELHSLYFDLTQKTFYPAQVNGSNLARHIVDTIDQAISGHAVGGAIGGPRQRIVILLGHDTNLLNIAGLLHISWMIPGSAADPVLPGGALVFEVRQAPGKPAALRLFYIAQTLGQMRRADPLTLDHPPAVAPIFIPGCSGTDGDATWGSVKAAFNRAIDPRYVVPGSR